MESAAKRQPVSWDDRHGRLHRQSTNLGRLTALSPRMKTLHVLLKRNIAKCYSSTAGLGQILVMLVGHACTQ